MEPNSEQKPNLFGLKLIVLLTRIEGLTKTLKAYYDQHHATKACDCSLCKQAEREFRRVGMLLATFQGQLQSELAS